MSASLSCLEFRREVLTDPNTLADGVNEHARSCGACRAFLAETRSGDRALREALSVDVPDGLTPRIRLHQTMTEARSEAFESELADALDVEVPEGLATRIIERQRFMARRARRRNVLTQFAVAASVAVAVAAGSLYYLQPGPVVDDDPLVAAVVQHSQDHRAASAHKAVPDELLAPALRLVGLEFRTRPQGVITSVTACDIRAQRALHMVMSGQYGPVDVYVMPGQHAARAMDSKARSWHAMVVPVQHGSLAVVGHPREQLDAYASTVKRSLRWRM